RLETKGANNRGQSLKRTGERGVDAKRQRHHKGQKSDRRPGPTYNRPAAHHDQSARQAKQQRELIDPDVVKKGTEQAHSHAHRQDRQSPPCRLRPGVSTLAAPEPKKRRREERHQKAVRVLRVVIPAAAHLAERGPIGPNDSSRWWRHSTD